MTTGLLCGQNSNLGLRLFLVAVNEQVSDSNFACRLNNGQAGAAAACLLPPSLPISLPSIAGIGRRAAACLLPPFLSLSLLPNPALAQRSTDDEARKTPHWVSRPSITGTGRGRRRSPFLSLSLSRSLPSIEASRTGTDWRPRLKHRLIYSLLSKTQAGPGRTVKQELGEISPNLVQRINHISVYGPAIH